MKSCISTASNISRGITPALKTVFQATVLLLCTVVLFAQEKDTVYSLPGLEITSTRKTSTSYKEPLAISVITPKEFAKSRGYGLDDALGMVPGVFSQSRYGNQDIRISIRGFGARGAGERSNSGTSRGIRVLLDGFPETEPDGRTSFDLIDVTTMNKVEVIRSNSSALWGNGAGGLVSISSNTAFESPFVSLQSYAGSYGFAKQVFQSGSDVGNGKLFLNISNSHSDGWRKHSASSQTIMNTGFTASAGERTTIGLFLLGAVNVFHIPGPLSQQQFDADPQQAQDDTAYYLPTYVVRDERRYNRLGRIGITLSHAFTDDKDFSASMFISPKYLQRSERNTFRDFTRYHIGGSGVFHNRMSVDDQYLLTSSIGIDEAYQDGAILFYQLKNGRRDSILVDNKREAANSFGLFILEELSINDRIIVSLGARYDNVTYSVENFMTPTGFSDKKSFAQISPKAGIIYRFSPTHSLYASYGGGVEVPAGNETDPPQGLQNARAINPLLEPITSTTMEIGSKLFVTVEEFMIRNLTYDIAVYRIITSHDIVPYQNGRFYLTAGKTQRVGIEAGIVVQSYYGLTYSAAATVSRNTYQEYTIDSVYTKRPIAPALSGKKVSFANNEVAGIPTFIMNHRLRYDAPFAEGLYAEVTAQSIGRYFADDGNTLHVPAYTIMNATVGYANTALFSQNLGVRGFMSMNNISDKKYISSAYINPDYGRYSSAKNEAVYLEPVFPRHFVASIGIVYRF
ncbi:MAG: TonB-dependent receptor [Bacteroidota bacterium]